MPDPTITDAHTALVQAWATRPHVPAWLIVVAAIVGAVAVIALVDGARHAGRRERGTRALAAMATSLAAITTAAVVVATIAGYAPATREHLQHPLAQYLREQHGFWATGPVSVSGDTITTTALGDHGTQHVSVHMAAGQVSVSTTRHLDAPPVPATVPGDIPRPEDTVNAPTTLPTTESETVSFARGAITCTTPAVAGQLCDLLTQAARGRAVDPAAARELLAMVH